MLTQPKALKAIIVLGAALVLTACGPSFSDKMKAVVDNSAKPIAYKDCKGNLHYAGGVGYVDPMGPPDPSCHIPLPDHSKEDREFQENLARSTSEALKSVSSGHSSSGNSYVGQQWSDSDDDRAMDLAIAHDAQVNGDYEQAKQWEEKARIDGQ